VADARASRLVRNGKVDGLSFGPDGALYAVEFVGRRTAVPGHYGHMGASDYELIVDRFISLNQIAPPLPRETEAQIEAEVQRCRRKKQCSSWNR